MNLRLLCATDIHISDEASCAEALECFERAVREHRPGAIVCLGDLFNNRHILKQLGPSFLRAAHAIHPDWLFVYGNHDGSETVKGENGDGWNDFCHLFGSAQALHTRSGHSLVTLADQQTNSDWRVFARGTLRPGSVVLSHSSFDPTVLDELAAAGARLVLNGHWHRFQVTESSDGSCRQINQAPFLFGGMCGDPAGFGVVDLGANSYTYRWVIQSLPLMPGNSRTFTDAARPPRLISQEPLGAQREAGQAKVTLTQGPHRWEGGPGRLRYYSGGRLTWERQYGRSHQDTCPPSLAEHGGRAYLIIGGTWVKPSPVGAFASLIVVDPYSGQEHYRVPVVGVSRPPALADGVLYIVGQWRELVAVELASGRELWRRRSQVETDLTRGLSWHDGQVGGGWSVCPPAVGKHVWTVNARGDLFGYDRQSGEERFVHPAAIPLNSTPRGPYANRLACVPDGIERVARPAGGWIFKANGQAFDDETGALQPNG